MDAAAVVGQVLSMAPIPYLQPLVETFDIIVSRIEQVKANKFQLQSIAQTVAQILLALNSQSIANSTPGMQHNHYDFELLLSRIAEFCTRTAKKKYIRSFLDASADQDEINSIQTQLNLSVDAFQISSQVSIQNSNKRAEAARQEDLAEINAVLKQLLENQSTLLTLVGRSGTDITSPHSSERNFGTENAQPKVQATIFGLLGEIRHSVTQASSSSDRDNILREILVELQKVSTEEARPPSVNLITAHLKPGLTANVLIGPLKWQMNMYMRKEALTQHLHPQQSTLFKSGPDGSRLFVEYLMKTDDVAVQYAALENFQQDRTVKHFFTL